MKKLTYVSAAVLSAALTTQQAFAADPKTANTIQSVATFSTATVVGGIAGGPVGMLIGALGGAWLSEQNKKAVATRDELNLAEAEIVALQDEITYQADEISDLEKRAAKKLEFQIMFPTGGDQLSQEDSQRIASLARYLNKNPQLKIRLDGHTDPRGTDEYNNVLSAERAKSVATVLTEQGVSGERIDIHAHGSSYASALASRDQYALDRRVNIAVFSEDNETVATTN